LCLGAGQRRGQWKNPLALIEIADHPLLTLVSDPKVRLADLTALFAPASVADLADTKGYRLQSPPWQTQKSLVISTQPTSESDI